MPKSKNKRKKVSNRKNGTYVKSVKNNNKFILKLNKIILWLAATGVLGVISHSIFYYFTGNITAEYVKNTGRGYEFRLNNESTTDQVVESFRVVPDFKQKFAFKVTKSVYGTFSKNGVSIPGGNSSYIPAFEFKEINGRVIKSHSSINFKVPPLISRDYLTPESMVVFVEYETKSSNFMLRKLENFLEEFNIKESKVRDKYLVSENYWTKIGNKSDVNALKEFCRDNDAYSKTKMCVEN